MRKPNTNRFFETFSLFILQPKESRVLVPNNSVTFKYIDFFVINKMQPKVILLTLTTQVEDRQIKVKEPIFCTEIAKTDLRLLWYNNRIIKLIIMLHKCPQIVHFLLHLIKGYDSKEWRIPAMPSMATPKAITRQHFRFGGK